MNLLIIPQLAVDIRFRGQPADDPPRHSHQILGQLIAEARDVAVHTGVSLLLLYVHEQNARALESSTCMSRQRPPAGVLGRGTPAADRSNWQHQARPRLRTGGQSSSTNHAGKEKKR